MADEYTRDSLQIARLEERIQTIVRDMEAQNEKLSTMSAQLERVLAALSEARGGWKTLMWLGGASASAGGLISWALNHLTFK